MPLHQETDTHLPGSPGCAVQSCEAASPFLLFLLCHTPAWGGTNHVLSGFQACAILISQRRFPFFSQGEKWMWILSLSRKPMTAKGTVLRARVCGVHSIHLARMSGTSERSRLVGETDEKRLRFLFCLSVCFSAPVPSTTHTCTHWRAHEHARTHTYTHKAAEDSIKINLCENGTNWKTETSSSAPNKVHEVAEFLFCHFTFT